MPDDTSQSDNSASQLNKKKSGRKKKEMVANNVIDNLQKLKTMMGKKAADDYSDDDEYSKKVEAEENSNKVDASDSGSNYSSEEGAEFFAKRKKKVKSPDVEPAIINIQPDENNDYVLLRQKNKQERLKMLKNLDLTEDIKEIESNTPVKEIPSNSRKRRIPEKKTPRTKVVSASVRKSVRLSNKKLETKAEDFLSAVPAESGLTLCTSRERNTDEIMPVAFTESVERGNCYETLKNGLDFPADPDTDFSLSNLSEFSEIVNQLCFQGDVTKIINSRIVSMAMHPTRNKILLLAGDKRGNLGFWDATNNNGVEFSVHTHNTYCVSFSEHNDMKFYSTGLDGTTRQGDLNNTDLQLVYTAEDDLHTTWHQELGQSMLIGQGNGEVKLVDMRTANKFDMSFDCHQRSVRTIHLYPGNENYFLTSSGVGECAVWDLRKNDDVKQKNPVLYNKFKKSLTGAFFSCKGGYLVATSFDNSIRIFECDQLKHLKQIHRIVHNINTGRWLSVIRAQWHPRREDAFVVGSMLNPKRIQIYQRSGEIITSLKDENMLTYCPVTVTHPSLPVYVGGNASGRIHVFTPPKYFDEWNVTL